MHDGAVIVKENGQQQWRRRRRQQNKKHHFLEVIPQIFVINHKLSALTQQDRIRFFTIHAFLHRIVC